MRLSALRFVTSALSLVALDAMAACSSSPPPAPPQAVGLVDDAGGTTDTHDTNPEGVPYPTQNLGRNQRGTTAAGVPQKAPGNVIQNFKFLGYPNADESKGLQTVALADYYDPTGTTYTILHLSVAGVWCVPCNDETDATVGLVPTFAKEKVVFVQALGDGPVEGKGATETDLQGWITKHKSNFTEVLDPGLANLGVFFDASAIPWNANIDARSMEILSAGVGYAATTDEYQQEIQVWVDWAAANPAAYTTSTSP